MANWKKVVVSGSSAELAGLTVDGTAIVGDLTGDVTGDVTGNVSGTAGSTTGNAGTATALETARTINGVSFDGTANITVTAAGSTLSDTVPTTKGGTGLTTIGSALTVLRVNAAGNGLEYGAASEGDVTGVVSSTTNQLVVTDPTGPEPSLAIQTAAIADAGTGLATADQIHTFVTTQTDAMAAGTTGNAATATQLETARDIGGVSFNGTANINLPGVNAAGNQDTSGNAATVTTNANLTGDVTSIGNATTLATVPTTKGGTGLTTIGSALTVLRVNAAGNGLEYGAASEGDVTGVVSSTTNQLVVTDPTGPEPSLAIQTAAIADAGTGLATADQIHTFVTTQTDTMAAGTTGNAATATNATNAADSALLNGEAKAAMFTSPAFTGTATAAALNVTGNTVIAGDLTVQGTASFESTENLLVKDRFIGLASGSAGPADGGIVIEQSNVGGGKGAVFAYDGLSTGRWGIDTAFNPTASTYTPAAFMSAVVEGGSGVDTPSAVGSDYVKKGNIFVGANQDIYIYS